MSGRKDPSDWLTLEQAADHLGVGLRLLRQWHADPDMGFPSVAPRRPGEQSGLVRVQRGELDAWFRAQDARPQRQAEAQVRVEADAGRRREKFRRRHADELPPRKAEVTKPRAPRGRSAGAERETARRARDTAVLTT